MRVLVGFEFSGTVRDAFIARGQPPGTRAKNTEEVMTRATFKDRSNFISAISALGAVKGHAEYMEFNSAAHRLLRFGATYGRIQEGWCNSEYQCNVKRDWYERKEKRIEDAVTELCASIGCSVTFQGDPRGYTMRVITPDGREIGVPTA